MRFARRSSLTVRSCSPLLDPPFDRSAQEPGYIKGYPPVRENGGQYTHAAAWIVMALARLGSGDEVAELFHMLNPINHTGTAAGVERYKTEPYVVAGDVYATPPHAGRGGWSWYTGSAAWMYRAGLESMLGLRRRGTTFSIDPCRHCQVAGTHPKLARILSCRQSDPGPITWWSVDRVFLNLTMPATDCADQSLAARVRLRAACRRFQHP